MSWGSKVRLFSNVPFSTDYQHSRLFTSKTEQKNYFNSLTSETITPGRQIKIDEGIIDINRYADVSDHYSYIIIENNSSELSGEKTYYCFVKEVEYINHKTARIHFEIDVIQTYMFDVDIKNSFVERAHMQRWNANGSPVKNVAPENLNIGSEYETVKTFKYNRTIDQYFETLLITTTKTLNYTHPNAGSGADVMSGVGTPLSYYIVLIPKEPQRSNEKYRVNVNGKYLYDWDDGDAKYITGAWRSLAIFSAQSDEVYANRIVGVNYLPFFPFNVTATKNVNSSGATYTITGATQYIDVEGVVDPTYYTIKVKGHPGLRLSNIINFNFNSELKSVLTSKGLKESKLMMYPFARAVVYDNLGNNFEIKAQYLNGNVRLDALTSISSSPKVAYVVRDYLGAGDFNNALISNINADVEIVNDHTATYIQGRKNSDRVAQTQAAFGGITQVAGGIAVAGVSTALGNPMGTMAGGAMAMGGLSNAFFGTSAIQAKLEDVKNIPPSLLSQAGATNLALGYELILPRIEIQMIGTENAQIVENHFKMYGVAVNKLIPINLRSRTHFNFIKTIGANITGSVPTKHLEKWRQIFDNGITFWHTNDMLNYTLSNNER